MITYKQIIKASKSFSDAHHILKNFGNGELWQLSDHDQSDNFEYPLMYMVDSPSSPGSKSWVYAFRVYFVSRVQAPKDRDGNPIYFEYTSEKSAMIACAQDFLSYWVQDNNYKMTIDQTLGVTTFIDVQEDNVTGCYIDIRFVVPFTYDSCIIPMDGVPDPDSLNVEIYVNDTLYYTLTPGSSLMLNVIDTDGNPVDATVSGSNVIVPAASSPVDFTVNDTLVYSQVTTDQTLQVTDSGGVTEAGALDAGKWKISDVTQTINTVPITPNKAETNKAITIRYANNDPVVVTTITDTETLFVGEIPDVVVPLNYATTFKDGQTTSFVPGDAGDVELGEGVDFFTLSNNNVFGNTNRFTAPDGTQTYGLYICDHACRDQVTGRIRTWHLGLDSATLLNHLAGNAGAGYTNGGLSGWHIPSDLVISQIYNREQPTFALNYAPFNINANSIANSIALSVTTSAALGLRFANSIIEISVGVGNTMKRITYRDCTEAELATL